LSLPGAPHAQSEGDKPAARLSDPPAAYGGAKPRRSPENRMNPEIEKELSSLGGLHKRMLDEFAKVIVGQRDVLEELLITIFAAGHNLLEGVPGLAKTLMISTLARMLSLHFKRIQFTPDLMPSDIVGTNVIEEDHTTGKRVMVFVPGPIFANVLLADEINRTPPKTQAALLQAMQ
jgi:MoxR-like ATPase